MKLSTGFWSRWYKADELKRVDIIKELEIEKSCIIYNDDAALWAHATATLVNSFLVDLAEYLEERYRKEIDV